MTGTEDRMGKWNFGSEVRVCHSQQDQAVLRLQLPWRWVWLRHQCADQQQVLGMVGWGCLLSVALLPQQVRKLPATPSKP